MKNTTGLCIVVAALVIGFLSGCGDKQDKDAGTATAPTNGMKPATDDKPVQVEPMNPKAARAAAGTVNTPAKPDTMAPAGQQK